MFGEGKTYFANNPVLIKINGLAFPPNSPIKVVRVKVLYNEDVKGDFYSEMGGMPDIEFEISSALLAIWNEYEYTDEQVSAQAAADTEGSISQMVVRQQREYSLQISTEYIDDNGVFTVTDCQDSQGRKSIPGGKCMIGGRTELERSLITTAADADISSLEHTNPRNGDASTKPRTTPERVGSDSITSWVDVSANGTTSIFYPADVLPQPDDTPGIQAGWDGHAPLVLRDSIKYVDFLFVNRRGAVETCSAQMLPSMNINVDSKQYSKTGRPSFQPKMSIMDIASGGRRSWSMSSGFITREWAEWWVLEFLMAKKRWMLYNGRFVPVTVDPAKKNTNIYDRTKQQMPSVEFTVTLALEG